MKSNSIVERAQCNLRQVQQRERAQLSSLFLHAFSRELHQNIESAHAHTEPNSGASNSHNNIDSFLRFMDISSPILFFCLYCTTFIYSFLNAVHSFLSFIHSFIIAYIFLFIYFIYLHSHYYVNPFPANRKYLIDSFQL